MINVELYLIEYIINRCKYIRELFGLSIDKIISKSSGYRIEKGEIPDSGNFVTIENLRAYANLGTHTTKEILFGNYEDRRNLLKIIFKDAFELILKKDLLKEKRVFTEEDFTDALLQKSMLDLAAIFGDFNLYRKLVIDGTNNGAEEILNVNFNKMFNMLWDLCEEKMMLTFEAMVIDMALGPDVPEEFKGEFESEQEKNFKYNMINSHVRTWINQGFCKVIVNEIINKCKEIEIFNIGFKVRALLVQIKGEISLQNSQKYVEVIYGINEIKELTIHLDGSKWIIPKEELDIDIKGYFASLDSDQTFDFQPKSEKIEFKKIPPRQFKEKELLSKVMEYIFDDNIDISQSWVDDEIFNITGLGEKEIEEEFEKWYAKRNFNSRTIHKLLDGNIGVNEMLQENVNSRILSLVKKMIKVQQKMLFLLSEEEFKKFAN